MADASRARIQNGSEPEGKLERCLVGLDLGSGIREEVGRDREAVTRCDRLYWWALTHPGHRIGLLGSLSSTLEGSRKLTGVGAECLFPSPGPPPAADCAPETCP